eukprot:5734-Heterococcus_DN1.PRE.3
MLQARSDAMSGQSRAATRNHDCGRDPARLVRAAKTSRSACVQLAHTAQLSSTTCVIRHQPTAVRQCATLTGWLCGHYYNHYTSG